MLRGRTWVMLVLAAAIGLTIIGQALSQEAQPGGGGTGGAAAGPGGQGRANRQRGGQMDPEQMRQRMEQFRQQAADRMKQSLGATDEEWKVLQPLVEKVQTLSRDVRGGAGGMGAMGGRAGAAGGRRGGGAAGDTGAAAGAQPAAVAEQTEIQKAATALNMVLGKQDASPDEIKAALTALREARAKVRAELEKAQKELREVVTVRQEAQLVVMGLLD